MPLSRRYLLAVAASSSVAWIAACGGSNATAPSAPAITRVTISGRLVSNPSHAPIAAAQILVSGTATTLATTDSDGQFVFETDSGVAPLQVELRAPNHLTRVTLIARKAHAATIDLISLAAPFDMSFYQLLRADPLPLAVWSTDPSFYIRTEIVDPTGRDFANPPGTGVAVPQSVIDMTISGVSTIVSEVTGNRFHVKTVETGVGYRGDAAGWIEVQFFDRTKTPQPTYSGLGGTNRGLYGNALIGIGGASMGIVWHDA